MEVLCLMCVVSELDCTSSVGPWSAATPNCRRTSALPCATAGSASSLKACYKQHASLGCKPTGARIVKTDTKRVPPSPTRSAVARPFFFQHPRRLSIAGLYSCSHFIANFAASVLRSLAKFEDGARYSGQTFHLLTTCP